MSLTNGEQIVALVDRLAQQLSTPAPTIRPLDLAAILSSLHTADLEAREREWKNRSAQLKQSARHERRWWIRKLTAVALIAVAAVLYLLRDNDRLNVAYLASQAALESQQQQHSKKIVELNQIHTEELKRFSLSGKVSMRPRLPRNAKLEVYRNLDEQPIATDDLDDDGEYEFVAQRQTERIAYAAGFLANDCS